MKFPKECATPVKDVFKHLFLDKDFAEMTVDKNGTIHAKLKPLAEHVNIVVKFS